MSETNTNTKLNATYSREYYLQNKAKWKNAYSKVQQEKYTCACGKTVSRKRMAKHEESQLHSNNIKLKSSK